jgi:transcriptional regulator with XRE-family HTH domain
MRKLDDEDKELKTKIASRIKSLREATGMLMTEYAKDTYKDKQSQSRWEKEGASIFTINKFCKERGITLSEFFNDPLFGKK